MFKLMEMQAEGEHHLPPQLFDYMNLNFARSVFPNNRADLHSIIQQWQPIFVLLAWEPRGQQLPTTTFELRSLVHDKVHDQDAALQAQLEKLQWKIEDESVLRLVYGDRPLETVRIFLLLTLYDLDLSIPIVCSSVLYTRAGTIVYPGGDIVQAHFRHEGMGVPLQLSRHDRNGRPCESCKPI